MENKHDLAKVLFELIENYGSQFGIHLNQDPEDMDMPEITVIFNKKTFTVECK